MKRLLVFSALFPLVLLGAARAADAPGANSQQEQVLEIIREVQNQQIEIAANQAKIDAKLATISEVIRIARINSSRGGR